MGQIDNDTQISTLESPRELFDRAEEIYKKMNERLFEPEPVEKPSDEEKRDLIARYRKIISQCNSRIKLDSKDVEAYSMKARSTRRMYLVSKDEVSEDKVFFELLDAIVVRMSDETKEIWSELALFCMTTEKAHGLSKVFLHPLANLKFNGVKHMAILGTFGMEVGDFDMAIHFFEKALEIEPDSGNHHISLAEAYEGSKDYEKAESHLNKAIEKDPDCYASYELLGKFYERRAYDIAPIGTHYEYFPHEVIEKYFENIRKAIKYTHTAYEKCPINTWLKSTLLRNLEKYYAMIKNYSLAEETYQKWCELRGMEVDEWERGEKLTNPDTTNVTLE